MPYYEVETSICCRLFIRADSFYHVLSIIEELEIEDEHICSIAQVHYNKVIV